jgi:5'-3' exonuclease
MSASHLILFDASGFAFRAYATQNPVYRESDGAPVGATLGFMQMIWKTLGAAEVDRPTHGAAVFDAPGKNFRHDLFPNYKANRPAARPLELDDQLPVMQLAADALGLRTIEKVGFEADDLVATLAARARREGMRVTIVSSDKDFGQLVVDGEIEIVDPLLKRRSLSADVIEKFGVGPELVPDVQALAGDAVDNVPGVDGCGLKRAGALIRRFGSLEGVLEGANGIHWPQVKTYLKRKHRYPGIAESRTGADWARLFLKLVTLRQDVELDVGPADFERQPIMRRHLDEILRVLEATSHAERIFQLDPKMVRVVPPMADPEEWWREELLHPGQPVPDMPQCGFYRRKLVKGGPFVPARIWREPEVDLQGKPTGQDLLRCEVGGKPRDPFAEWVRLSMMPIKKSEYAFEQADAAHAKVFRPDDPKANPRIPIDITKLPAPRCPVPTPKRRRKYDNV